MNNDLDKSSRNNDLDKSSRELETEASATRARLSNNLDELANHLTPGRVLDEVMTYSRGGGADFLRGLRNAAAANPIPTLLIGAGCAMFLSGKGRISMDMFSWGSTTRAKSDATGARYHFPTGRRTGNNGRGAMSGLKQTASSLASKASSMGSAVSDTVSDSAEAAASAASNAASQLRDTATGAASQLRDTATGAASQLRDTATGAATRVKETVAAAGETLGEYAGSAQEQLQERTARMRDQTTMLSRQISDKAASLIEEQPLLMAAGGLLVGAALAALLPRTKFEDSYLGTASDKVKEQIGDVASQQFEQAKSAAGEVIEKVKKTAEEQGVSVAAATDAVRTAADKLKNVTDAGMDAVREGTDRFGR
jgi:ElaB/YqjD/DUF883 family membrane-anchored ribosome-binding protein